MFTKSFSGQKIGVAGLKTEKQWKSPQKERTRPVLLMFMEPSLSVKETHLGKKLPAKAL